MWRKAENIEFKNFFSWNVERISSKRLWIPEFQRNYVWEKDKVKDLLDSINENDNWYYIWNIVTIKSDWGTAWKDLVLDWQQRLITITLLLAAVYFYNENKNLCKRIKNFLQR